MAYTATATFGQQPPTHSKRRSPPCAYGADRTQPSAIDGTGRTALSVHKLYDRRVCTIFTATCTLEATRANGVFRPQTLRGTTCTAFTVYKVCHRRRARNLPRTSFTLDDDYGTHSPRWKIRAAFTIPRIYDKYTAVRRLPYSSFQPDRLPHTRPMLDGMYGVYRTQRLRQTYICKTTTVHKLSGTRRCVTTTKPCVRRLPYTRSTLTYVRHLP